MQVTKKWSNKCQTHIIPKQILAQLIAPNAGYFFRNPLELWPRLEAKICFLIIVYAIIDFFFEHIRCSYGHYEHLIFYERTNERSKNERKIIIYCTLYYTLRYFSILKPCKRFGIKKNLCKLHTVRSAYSGPLGLYIETYGAISNANFCLEYTEMENNNQSIKYWCLNYFYMYNFTSINNANKRTPKFYRCWSNSVISLNFRLLWRVILR